MSCAYCKRGYVAYCIRCGRPICRYHVAGVVNPGCRRNCERRDAKKEKEKVVSLTTHSPQEPCSACGAFTNWSEIITDLLDELKKVRRSHTVCEDTWYSCPKTEDYIGNEDKDYCACGADRVNASIDTIINKVRSLLPEERS